MRHGKTHVFYTGEVKPNMKMYRHKGLSYKISVFWDWQLALVQRGRNIESYQMQNQSMNLSDWQWLSSLSHYLPPKHQLEMLRTERRPLCTANRRAVVELQSFPKRKQECLIVEWPQVATWASSSRKQFFHYLTEWMGLVLNVLQYSNNNWEIKGLVLQAKRKASRKIKKQIGSSKEHARNSIYTGLKALMLSRNNWIIER